MAIATDTTQGSVLMTGDLYGMGTEPVLRPTGVTPDEYPIPTTIVDAKGRVVAVERNTEQSLDVGCATNDTCGIARVGVNLTISNGVANVATGTATTSGVFRIGSGIDVDDNGVISVEIQDPPTATTSIRGVIQVPESGGIEIDANGNVSIPKATTTTYGVVKSGSNIVSTDGVVSRSSFIPATTTTLGLVKPSLPTLTFDGNGALTYNDSYAVATQTTVGRVSPKTPEFLSIDGNGVLSVVTTNTATGNVLGWVRSTAGDPLNIDAQGVVSLTTYATPSTFGIIKSAGSGIDIDANGQLVVSATSFPRLNEVNGWTAAQWTSPYVAPVVDGTNFSVSHTTSNVIVLDLEQVTGASGVVNMPTEWIQPLPPDYFFWEGASFVFIIKQAAAGGKTLTFDDRYRFHPDTPPNTTPTGGAIDVVLCVIGVTVIIESDVRLVLCQYLNDFK
jgi:hypothetical protein